MVPLKYNFARKASHDYCWKSLEKKMQHNRKYRNLGWWAAHWLFYNLGRIQNDGNLNDGFWLIQKLDCFANKLKNPIILWSKLCIIWLFVYDYLLKLQLFSDFSPVWAMILLTRPNSKSFLKCLGRELSEYMVLVSGKWILARLDFR